jgi:hypothetical protein
VCRFVQTQHWASPVLRDRYSAGTGGSLWESVECCRVEGRLQSGRVVSLIGGREMRVEKDDMAHGWGGRCETWVEADNVKQWRTEGGFGGFKLPLNFEVLQSRTGLQIERNMCSVPIPTP